MCHLHSCHILFDMSDIFEHVVRYSIINNNSTASWCLFNEPIDIDELIKLANQSNQQVKGALVIDAAKIAIILFLKTKMKLVVWSIAVKDEARNVMFWSKKDTSNVGKNTLPNGSCRTS